MKFKLLSLFLLLPVLLNGQDCGECSRPSVALYDFQINVPRPDSAQEILKWLDLFWTGTWAKANIKSGETSGCISWFDGAMINANTLNDGTLKYGMEYTNLPAAGSIGTSYILWGNISGTPGNYTAELVFETGESRELVKSVSVNFSVEGNGEVTAGEQLASQFGSIMQVIRNFELYKRDNFTDVAIKDLWTKNSPEDIVVTPEKKTANVGETINVEISLIDCDGVPLQNRTIHLASTVFEGNEMPGPQNGHFTEATVTTNSDGKATAQFVIDGPGVAVARVSFPHYKPVGRYDCYFGEAYINVPTESVEITGLFKYKTETKGDTTWTISDENSTLFFRSNTNEHGSGEFKIKGLVERDYSIPMVKAFRNPLSFSVSGNFKWSRSFNKNFTVSTSSGNYPQILIENEDFIEKGVLPEGEVLINPYQPDEFPEVDVRSDLQRNGKSMTKTYSTDYGWQTDNNTIDETSSFFMGFNNSNAENKTITKVSEDVYTYEYTDDYFDINTGTVLDYHGHSLTTESKEEWFVRIKLNNVTTGVEQTGIQIPADYSLSQNYPNPFNPLTMISYQLPINSNVSLKVYNILGQDIATLVNEQQSAGTYSVSFDASAYSSGIYYFKLSSGSFNQVRKMVLMK